MNANINPEDSMEYPNNLTASMNYLAALAVQTRCVVTQGMTVDGRKTITLRRFGKVVASYTANESGTVYSRD